MGQGYAIAISGLGYSINGEKEVLKQVDLQIPAGAFVAILGENGAGKTSLLDMAMGFRKPTTGSLQIDGFEPHRDHWEKRRFIAYLSEKMDLPGDWSVTEFLRFNEAFYPDYSRAREAELLTELKVDPNGRIGNLSAGELRRVQVVGALSIKPKLVVVDEITAVLDIIGRQRFLRLLHVLNTAGCTILLATNILEDLAEYVSHICLITRGKVLGLDTLADFLGGAGKADFSSQVVQRLEAA